MKTATAWAFEIKYKIPVLGKWAMADKKQLIWDHFGNDPVPPSYKPVMVKMIKQSDWLKIKRLLEKHGEQI